MNLLAKYRDAAPTVKASIWFVGCSVLQKGLSFVAMPLFAAFMTEEAYGSFMVYQSWSSVILIFATLNLHYQVYNNGAIRFRERTNQYVSSLMGLSWTASFLVFLLLGLLSGVWAGITGKPQEWVLFMFLESFFGMPYCLFLCRERMANRYKMAVAVTTIYVFASTILGIILVRYCQATAENRILGMALVEVVVGSVLLVYLFRSGGRIYDAEVWKYSLRLALPLIPHYLATVLLTASDRIMIGRYCGDDKVAIYAVASSLGTVTQIIANSSNAAINPWIYRTLAERNFQHLRRRINLLLLLMAAAALIPVVFGALYIRLFMEEAYLEAISLIGLIAGASFFIYLYSLILVIELYYEQTKLTSIATVGAAVLNVALNYLGIRYFDYRAAAITTLICYVLLCVVHYLSLRKISKTKGFQISEIIDVRTICLIGVIVCLFMLLMTVAL